MNKVKNQHYVPRFYLNYFTSSNKKIFVYDKNIDKVFETSVDNIACQNYFYDSDILQNNFLEEQYLEKFYSSIESEFAPYYMDFIAKIDANTKYEISEEDKQTISRFLSFQIERTSEHREVLRQFTFALKDQLLEKGVSEEQLVKLGFNINGLNPKDLHIESIIHNNDFRTVFSEVIQKHIWIILENNTNLPFLTSDNPIAKKANIFDKYRSYGGFASKGIEIIFPINPKYLLVFCEREFFKELDKIENQKLIITNPEAIEYYNLLEIIDSNRQMFSRENIFQNISVLKEQFPEAFNNNRKRVL